MNKRLHLTTVLMAIAVGLGGELHIYFPALGTIAMLDLISYAIALPIIVMKWSEMGRFMRRSLIWAFAWTGAAMLANLIHYQNLYYWVKCVSLASSSWAIMAASYLILRKDARIYLWYLVGAGLGGWISLYYFRNGALESFAAGGLEYFGAAGSSTEKLMEKQIYPNVARGILYGFVLPFFIWWQKMPIFLVFVSVLTGGFWLLFHGGSRSSFGMFTAAAAVGFLVVYAKNFIRRLAKNPMVLLLMSIVGLAIVFGAYKYMAKSNMLGEGELNKYEYEFGSGSRGAIKGRAGFDHAVAEAFESYGIGEGAHLRHHSVISNALACEGFIGFLFWVYFYWQCFWFVRHRLPYSGKYAAFIFLMILAAGWDVFGSPFGTRHKFFVLMSFIAICQDRLDYGYNTVFMDMPNRPRLFRRY